MRIEVLFTHPPLPFFDWGLGTTAISPATWAWLPAWGSETHGRRPNQGGRGILYFEDHGGIAPAARYHQNFMVYISLS